MKTNLHLVIALKRYLNEKNLIHGRETATKTIKIKVHSVTTLKRYLNEKNLIHGEKQKTKLTATQLHSVTALKRYMNEKNLKMRNQNYKNQAPLIYSVKMISE